MPTLIREGATIGASCVVGNDLVVGRFAMVGMGSVVTKSVDDFHLVFGNPAKLHGFVCRCGELLVRIGESQGEQVTCKACDLVYRISDGKVVEMGDLGR